MNSRKLYSTIFVLGSVLAFVACASPTTSVPPTPIAQAATNTLAPTATHTSIPPTATAHKPRR